MSSTNGNAPATPSSDQNPLPTRFEVELEFVQSLANIQYVTYLLTQQQIWKSPNFKNYLKYLEYWCNPLFAMHCVSKLSLHFKAVERVHGVGDR